MLDAEPLPARLTLVGKTCLLSGEDTSQPSKQHHYLRYPPPTL